MSAKHSEDFFIRVLFNKIKIEEVMKTPPVTIYEMEDLSVAEQKFVEHSISHLIVINKEGKLRGLVSPKYLYKTHAPKKCVKGEILQPRTIVDGDSFYHKDALDKYFLVNVMFATPFTLGPEDSFGNAILTMAKRNISCIPIIDKSNTLLGVLTNQEIVNYITNVLTE